MGVTLTFQSLRAVSSRTGSGRITIPGGRERNADPPAVRPHRQVVWYRALTPGASYAIGRRLGGDWARRVDGALLWWHRSSATPLRRHRMSWPHWYPVSPPQKEGGDAGTVMEQVSLKAQGVASERVRESVCSALRFIRGVADVAFDRRTSEVTLRYDPHYARIEQFRVAIWAVGCRVDSLIFPDEHQGWHAIRTGEDRVGSAARPQRCERGTRSLGGARKRVDWPHPAMLGKLRTGRGRPVRSEAMSAGDDRAVSRRSMPDLSLIAGGRRDALYPRDAAGRAPCRTD